MSKEEIKRCIDRYYMVINDKDYYFKTIWSLYEFLSQSNTIIDFTVNGIKWVNYSKSILDNDNCGGNCISDFTVKFKVQELSKVLEKGE